MKGKHSKKESSSNNQGEGDRESAARYNEATQDFVKSGKVKGAAKRAAGQDPREAEESEREGRKHAKEEDPAVKRDYKKPRN
jgi:hypothetical protein